MREERKCSKAKESYMAAVPGIFACLLLLMFSKSINIPCAQVRHSLAVALALNSAQGELREIEIGWHALNSPLGVRDYADKVGKNRETIRLYRAAAEVTTYIARSGAFNGTPEGVQMEALDRLTGQLGQRPLALPRRDPTRHHNGCGALLLRGR
jgi:hypothetical protein